MRPSARVGCAGAPARGSAAALALLLAVLAALVPPLSLHPAGTDSGARADDDQAPPAELPRAAGREERPLPQPGMSPEQVRGLLGPPAHVSRQILAHRHIEQWLYDQPHHLRLQFDCPRGQKPQLQSVRPHRPGKP
jgi:hypothetical protein